VLVLFMMFALGFFMQGVLLSGRKCNLIDKVMSSIFLPEKMGYAEVHYALPSAIGTTKMVGAFTEANTTASIADSSATTTSSTVDKRVIKFVRDMVMDEPERARKSWLRKQTGTGTWICFHDMFVH